MKLIKEENYMEITKKTNYRFACVILAVLLGLTAIAVPLSTAYTSNSTIAFAGTADGMYLSDNSVIAVFVAGVLVGYLFAVVVDGIVIYVSGASSAEWFAEAVALVLWQPYTSSISLAGGGGGGSGGGGF
jgi:hypothetical protein